jgi:hypothetical protein
MKRPDFRDQIDAGAVRQGKVEQQYVGLVAPDCRNDLPPIPHRVHDDVRLAQEGLEPLADHFMIVGNQQPRLTSRHRRAPEGER